MNRSADLLKGRLDVLLRDEREDHQLPYALVDVISFPVGNLKTMLLDLGIHCLGPMEHTSMDLGSRENFSNTLPYASFKICCKQGYSRGDGRHFTMVWNTAIR